MPRLKIAIAQINPIVGDFPGNFEKIKAKINEAEKKGIDLIIFSELVISGYPVWDLANKTSFIRAGLKSLRKIQSLSRSKELGIVVGFIDSNPRGEKSYNALAFIHRGKVLHKQYKMLLPNYDVFLEQIFFESGGEQKPFKFKGIKIAASICEDIWDDHYLIKPISKIKKNGARLLINISASPFYSKVARVRSSHLSRKASQYGIAIVYANQIGGQDELIFDGQSLACDERGNVFFKAPAFCEGVFEFDWAPGDKKEKILKSSQIKPAQNIYKALVLGLRDYVKKNNFSKVVIGLSGGIDSALVASLAYDALGPKAILGVSLPGPFSSPGSVSDAKKLARNLNIELRTISIKSLYKHIKGTKKFPNRVTLAEENLQARLRALELMYISNRENRLLLTTGNKSEMAMGYCTLYGDMCGGLGVIGDVYKTQVYELAHYRNEMSPVIPEETLKKAPSAELRPKQKDSDSLPPYEVLDKVIYYYVEQNLSLAEILKKVKGRISRTLISKVIRAVDHNEYKRRQAPPVLKVTQKAWFGRRMPITNSFQGI